MARFNLRPFFRRLSSRAESTQSEGNNSDTTAATSATPSPNLPVYAATTPRKSSSLLSGQTAARTIPAERFPPRNSSLGSVSVEGQVSESQLPRTATATATTPALEQGPPLSLQISELRENPRLVVEEPTPDALAGRTAPPPPPPPPPRDVHEQPALILASPRASRRRAEPTNTEHSPHPSIVDSANAPIVRTLIEASNASATSSALPTASLPEYLTGSLPNIRAMLTRKIWVKRPGASATLVQIREEDLVDDVRDMILRKYANSLGKTFDAPDMTLRVAMHSDHAGPRSERMLGPEEEICRMLDTYYPGGQTVDDALIIDTPPKRTPRPSPRNLHHASYHAMDDLRPQETGNDYFPPMTVIQPTMPHTTLPQTGREHHQSLTAADHPRSISVLNTGTLPPLPSPGAASRRHRAEREHRPKYGRQHTSSPTIISQAPNGVAPISNIPLHVPHRPSNRPRHDSNASEAHHPNAIPVPPPLPSPPAPTAPPTAADRSTPTTPSGSAPSSAHPYSARPRKVRKASDKIGSRTRSPIRPGDVYGAKAAMPNISSMLDASVPPISVLIVEDNIINLRILQGLMKRLKVRWQTAMNGQIAVDKWKTGGYHLVLMDIQMPVMNGLQATKEIRRLERVNGIGVFSSAPASPAEGRETTDENGQEDQIHDPADDKLAKGDGFFKSPVIIVALTASSLQSDRHEALAAGCNDFLTKPVNFVWLERKVKEWGCMQALIDFDGWRKWKDYAAKEEQSNSEEQKQKNREKEEKEKIKMEKMAKLQEKQRQRQEDLQKEKERKAKRQSMDVGEVPQPEAPVATVS